MPESSAYYGGRIWGLFPFRASLLPPPQVRKLGVGRFRESNRSAVKFRYTSSAPLEDRLHTARRCPLQQAKEDLRFPPPLGRNRRKARVSRRDLRRRCQIFRLQ